MKIIAISSDGNDITVYRATPSDARRKITERMYKHTNRRLANLIRHMGVMDLFSFYEEASLSFWTTQEVRDRFYWKTIR